MNKRKLDYLYKKSQEKIIEDFKTYYNHEIPSFIFSQLVTSFISPFAFLLGPIIFFMALNNFMWQILLLGIILFLYFEIQTFGKYICFKSGNVLALEGKISNISPVLLDKKYVFISFCNSDGKVFTVKKYFQKSMTIGASIIVYTISENLSESLDGTAINASLFIKIN